MKFVKVSDTQYLNLSHINYIRYDPDDGDSVVHFGDDNLLHLDTDETKKLLKVVEEFSAVSLEEVYHRFGIPWPPQFKVKEEDKIAINNVVQLEKPQESGE